MSDLVMLSDPAIARVPVDECGEPMVDLRHVRALRLDPRLADPAGDYAHLRRGVTDRLVTAQTVLPARVGLLIVVGYVPPPGFGPHNAGAAVDLTLCAADGAELWMGTQVNDAGLTEIDEEASANRATLVAALSAVGLVNYPAEWWHWSYGDRYWAFVNKARHARYGPVSRHTGPSPGSGRASPGTAAGKP